MKMFIYASILSSLITTIAWADGKFAQIVAVTTQGDMKLLDSGWVRVTAADLIHAGVEQGMLPENTVLLPETHGTTLVLFPNVNEKSDYSRGLNQSGFNVGRSAHAPMEKIIDGNRISMLTTGPRWDDGKILIKQLSQDSKTQSVKQIGQGPGVILLSVDKGATQETYTRLSEYINALPIIFIGSAKAASMKYAQVVEVHAQGDLQLRESGWVRITANDFIRYGIEQGRLPKDTVLLSDTFGATLVLFPNVKKGGGYLRALDQSGFNVGRETFAPMRDIHEGDHIMMVTSGPENEVKILLQKLQDNYKTDEIKKIGSGPTATLFSLGKNPSKEASHEMGRYIHELPINFVGSGNYTTAFVCSNLFALKQ